MNHGPHPLPPPPHPPAGVVYEGRWRGLRVAVKTILFPAPPPAPAPPTSPVSIREGARGSSASGAGSGGLSGPQALAQCRVVSEAATCLALNHPNIVATYKWVGWGGCVLVKCWSSAGGGGCGVRGWRDLHPGNMLLTQCSGFMFGVYV